MKKHLYFTAALLALLLLFCSCQPGDTASVAPTESITAGASEQPLPSGKEYKYGQMKTAPSCSSPMYVTTPPCGGGTALTGAADGR